MSNQHEEYSRVLEDCKLYLTDSWQAIEKGCKPDDFGDIAVYVLANHAIECLDGITILVSKGSVLPCQFLLRGILDALLGIMFILKADSTNRGLAYFYFNLKQEQSYWEMFDPSTKRGNDVRKDLKSDIAGANALDLDPLRLKGVQDILSLIKSYFDDSAFHPLIAELVKSPKAKHWYSLFGGANEMRSLAKSVDFLSGYEKHYRPWSQHIHGTGTLSATLSITENILSLRPIRHPQGIDKMCEAAGSFAIVLAIRLFERYDPTNVTFMARYKDLDNKVKTLVREHQSANWSD